MLAFLVSTLDACVQERRGQRIHVMGTLYVAAFGLPKTTPAARLHVSNQFVPLEQQDHPLQQREASHNQPLPRLSVVVDDGGNGGVSPVNPDLRPSADLACSPAHGVSAERCNESQLAEHPGLSTKRDASVLYSPSNAASALLAAANAAGSGLGSSSRISAPLSDPRTMVSSLDSGDNSLSAVAWQALAAANSIMQRLRDMNEEYGVAMMSAIGIDIGDVRAGILGRRAVSYQVCDWPCTHSEWR